MKAITALTLLGSALTATAQYLNQTGPYHLELTTTACNSTSAGLSLYPCHAGAAIESLCVSSNITATNYYYNYTTSEYYNSTSGYLTWLLVGGNFEAWQPMALQFDPSTNVALPQFQPAEYGTLIGFDGQDNMYVPYYVDDRVYPVDINSTGVEKHAYRWLVCNTYYSGYQYRTLAWQMGEYPPQNPTCEPVNVTRVAA